MMELFDPLTGLIIVLFGLLIGIVSGMFGVGGGTMIVPLFNLVFGMPIVNAAATSLLCIMPTAFSGAVKHLHQKTVHLKVGVILGATGAVASVFGALISEHVPALLIVILTAIVIFFSSFRMFVEARRPPAVDETKSLQERGDKIRRSMPLVIVLGICAGLMAGLIGVGGGFVIVPFCVAYLGFRMSEAAGTSLVAIGIIAIPGIIMHAVLGQIEWFYGLALIIGTVPGAQLGAWLITKLPENYMRIAFAILLCIVGGLLIANNLVF